MSRARPKYQVFISSTFSDLSEIRQAVTWEVLAAAHIPAGMENFPATHDRGWEVIRRTIDKSDYYVVIVAGRYGTIDPSTGKSWTQREYEYAIEKGLPVLAFIRDEAHITAPDMERDVGPREKLAEFVASLKNAHHRKPWSTKEDLATKVVQALNAHIIDDEESERPRPGWYRGDQMPSTSSLDEFARLSAENDRLTRELASVSSKAELVLVDRHRSAPVDETQEMHRLEIVETPSFTNTFALAVGAFNNGPTKQDHAINGVFTAWLDLKIGNIGGRPARAVVAEFTVTGVAGVFLDKSQHPGEVLYPPPYCTDPNQFNYVSEYSIHDKVATVQQRIRQVGVDHYESLVAMGFRSAAIDTGDDQDCSFHVEYSIKTEDGLVAEGSFDRTLLIRGRGSVSEDDYDELHMGR